MRVLWMTVLLFGLTATLAAQTFSFTSFQRGAVHLHGQPCFQGMYTFGTSNPGFSDMAAGNISMGPEVQKNWDGSSCSASTYHEQLFLSFNTSTIGSATVASAVLRVWVNGTHLTSVSPHTLHVTPFTAGSPSMIGCATHPPSGSVGSIAYSSITNPGQNSIAITPSAINRTGTTALRLNITPCPSDPPTPTAENTAGTASAAYVWVTGNTNPPQLIITLSSGARLIIVTEGT